MGAEYEVKYAANPLLLQEIAGDYPGGASICMESTYYDSPDGSLSKKRITLRRRLENGISVCTVKTPLDRLGRGEWEIEESSVETAIGKLCKLGAPEELLSLTRAGVIAICGAKFTRQAIPVKTDDFSAELALDKGVLTGGGRQTPLCEVELEYKSGNMAAFFAFTERFAACYALQAQPLSKFRRALNLYLGET